MKLLILLCALMGVTSAATCTSKMQNVTSGVKLSDDSPLDTAKVDSAEDCCTSCSSNSECVAWTFEESGFLQLHGRCYLHASRDLPTEDNEKATAGITTPPPPTPPPAPTPAPPPGSVTNWVVIAAGSSTFQNYRHQADACHSYQIAKKNGIPEENIILMMMDDVANSRQNPFPGKMFNKPTAEGEQGVDVYDGCTPDYRGKDVTAQLFLDVLQGNADAVAGKGNGKVLKSGPHDKVFVNFADHGGGGIIEFPNGPYLHAKDLNTALQAMHSKNMYDKLVFYLEACNSGSMFENLLPKDINVFATTAANPSEPSWGTYCPPQDKVNGKSIGSCLGDLYSVNWMEDSDTATGQGRTLDGQFKYVKNITASKSHVMEYGTVGSFDQTDKVSDYQSHKTAGEQAGSVGAAPSAPKDAVDARDIELVTDFYAYLRATEPADKTVAAKELLRVVEARERADTTFPAIIAALQQGAGAPLSASPDDLHACRKGMYTAVEEHCGRFDSYSLKFSKDLTDLCERRPLADIEAAIEKGC